MSAWIKIITALLNRGACWDSNSHTTSSNRCTLY